MRLRARISVMIAAVPFVNAASVKGPTVSDIVATTILAHPAIAAFSRGSTPEGFVLGLEAPGSTWERGSLDNHGADQEGTEDDQRLVHVVLLRGNDGSWYAGSITKSRI